MKKITNYFVLLTFCFAINVEAQKTKTAAPTSFDPSKRARNLSDSALVELVQRQTFRYFWDFAHPVSGMARERSNVENYEHDVTATGGTGFGIMSVIVATERKWIQRDTAARFTLKLINFLLKADSYHGAFPHWLNGATGKTVPFSRRDDGADLVETAYLFQGLLCARQYFTADNPVENDIRSRINWMWGEIDWTWFGRDAQNVLYWHWSPNYDWSMNVPIRGFNECLITYILAASGEQHPVGSNVYHGGWVQSLNFKNGHEYYGIKLPLGFDYGGPLFFSQYSFMGLDPRGLADRYANYWEQNLNHTLINREHAVRNPKHFKGYGENSWGLTASDTYNGYAAHSPTEDLGTISPTAALSAFPYTPKYSMQALRHFYDDLGDKIWSEYGFVDAFNESQNWYAKSHIAIDQGPIIVMIENYRTGLLWRLFMSCPEIKNGLKKLEFTSPWLSDSATRMTPNR